MTQEDKELLLKDLCARLPYDVKVKHEAQDFPSTLLWVDAERLSAGRKADKIGVGSDWGNIEFIKPYLRPLSSMTEKEIDELKELCTMYEPSNSPNIGFEDYGIRVLTHHLSDDSISFLVNMKVIDWLNSHHFDYRGLIEKGLAIEVTKENNPYGNL